MHRWRFDQVPDAAATTCTSVLAGAPILVVIHYSEDHSWAFLDGGMFDVSSGRIVRMDEVLALDDTLDEIADLAPGWVATRAAVGAPWVRQRDPAV